MCWIAGKDSPPGVANGVTATHPREAHMSKSSGPVRINLTDEQKAQIKEATGKDASAIELSAEELEERTMPRKVLARRAVARKSI